ncbi:TetR/AcrR family transcriptional regulator C-terminal domain-containing protein [Tardiphaga sp. 804_B3_N1_9]|uniref:TetR/AcrR family transcriptional regulator C-terminal domain-containing protein n=1 Tax=Tardiphaga sp. 804_B3_N1_9 TaxID=3240786 RepID=UPI003F254DF8
MSERPRRSARDNALIREERQRSMYAEARATFAHGGIEAFVERFAKGHSSGKKTKRVADPTSATDLFRAAVADRMDPFTSAMAIAVQGGNVQGCLEAILFHCALLALDRELAAIGRIVVSERDRYPQFAHIFYEECIERLPVALSMWLDMLNGSGVLSLENPASAADMLVTMMTADLRYSELFEWQKVASADDCRVRARHCANVFLHGCRAASDDARQVEHARS